MIRLGVTGQPSALGWTRPIIGEGPPSRRRTHTGVRWGAGALIRADISLVAEAQAGSEEVGEAIALVSELRGFRAKRVCGRRRRDTRATRRAGPRQACMGIRSDCPTPEVITPVSRPLSRDRDRAARRGVSQIRPSVLGHRAGAASRPLRRVLPRFRERSGSRLEVVSIRNRAPSPRVRLATRGWLTQVAAPNP